MATIRKVPQAIQDRLVVSEEKPEKRSAGGIILPDSAVERQCVGTVVSVGPRVSKESSIKVGSVVRFPDYAGSEIPHNNKTYIVLKESDLFYVEK